MLTLREVSKSYGRVRAVDGVSLRVAAGEVVGLLGPNGAGKSTTVALVTGLMRPDSGSVTVGAAGDPSNASVRRAIGFAPQELALYDMLTATETVTMFARLYGAFRSRRQVLEALDMVGLATRADERVGGYSGGMKRRLNLAVALIHEPPLLVLDEPTAGVDPQSRAHVRGIIRSRAASGCAVLLTTHDMEEAEKLSDRIALMDHGKIQAEGTVDELVAIHGAGSSRVARGLESVLLKLTGRELRE
ncbi:MAG: ABC transporter ATP-binding protein [Planctomycetes bacterium]|nr:ABC transporter ATP-binding protein [Planctomycetota bacterium]